MPKAQPSKLSIIVSVSEAFEDRLEDVLQRLRARGMAIDEVMSDLNLVAGTVDESKMSDLASLDGVSKVEQARSFKIAPPSSDTQ